LIKLAIRETRFNNYVLAIDKASFAKTSSKCGDDVRRIAGRPAAEIANQRKRRRLRLRDDGPRSR